MNNKPNLFLIGCSKCGSTFLHYILEQHPDICMSLEKEPWFFNRENYEKDFNFYYSLFKHRKNEKIIGESSPIYSETTYFQEIPKRIYNFNPSAKIIYIVREPFSRLKSVYMQAMSSGHWYEKKFYDRTMSTNFSEAIFDYPPFLEATKYWTHIQNYKNFFPDSQIKVILFEDLTNNYEKTIKDILTFLEVDSSFIPDANTSTKNESRGKKIYNTKLSTLSKITPQILKKITPKKLKNKIYDYIKNKSNVISEPEQLTQEDIEKIESILDHEVKNLYKHLNIQDDPWNFFRKIS